jgi:signal transduction histidine kinase
LSYKQKSIQISVKAKTITLVLAIYILLSAIFLLIRYSDIQGFVSDQQSSELQKVKQIYKLTKQRVKEFYTTRGYANIDSYGVKDAFKNNDIQSLRSLSSPRWNIIEKENSNLTSFCFYDKDGELLTYFGESAEKKLSYLETSKVPYDGFWYSQGSFNYHVVVEAKDEKSNIIGYIAFVINTKYFLSEIKKSMDIYAYISYQKNDEQNIVSMLINDDTIESIIRNNEINNFSEISTQSGIFLPHIIKGSGIDAKNDFHIIFLQDMSHFKEILYVSIVQSLTILIVLFFITTIIINYGFDLILKELKESDSKLRISQNTLENLNKNLQKKVEQEIHKRLKKEREANEKERLLIHQSKLASMGEMIGNIAHQWRQPLTQLSSILINLELYFERNKLTKEKFKVKSKEANDQISFMSKTIDDFRNFYTSNKQVQEYSISSAINDVRKLMDSSLTNYSINFKVEIINDFSTQGYPNEISQALLNIISNAKDIILQRHIKDGFILVRAFTKDNKKNLTVLDNAGGVEVTPIEKIFEPYFSTKSAKNGTGIGLYMTKIIIEKNNNATIDVENTTHGVLFTITF